MALKGKVFWIAAAGALVAAIASAGRHRAKATAATAAVLVAVGAIALVYYEHSRALPTSSGAVQARIQTGPVTWSRLYINGAAASQTEKPSNISSISIAGTNVGAEEIKLDDAYFLSGVDGTKLNVQIGRGGRRYKIQDVSSLPPGAFFFVVSDPIGPKDQGLSPDNFLKTWSTIYFVVKYNGSTQKIEFDQETVESMLTSAQR
jgi:hypothetical protein